MEMIYNILVHPVLKTLGILFVGMSSFITVGTFWPLSGLEPVLIKLVHTWLLLQHSEKSRIESDGIDIHIT